MPRRTLKAIWNKQQLEDMNENFKELYDGVSDAKENPAIPDKGVGSDKLKDGAVDTPIIKDGAVTGEKIKDNSINKDKIVDNSIDANKLFDDFNFIAIFEEDIDPRTITKNGYYLLTKNSFIPKEYGASCILEFFNASGWKELKISSLALSSTIRTQPRYTYKFRGKDTEALINWQVDGIAKDSVERINIKDGSIDSNKLDDNFNFIGLFDKDIDPLTFTKNGRYLVLNNTHLPSIFKGQGIIDFDNSYNWLEFKLTGLPTTFEQKTAQRYEFRVNKGSKPTKIDWISEFDKPDIVSGLKNIEDSTINGANFTKDIRKDLGNYENLDIVEQQGYLTYASISVHNINQSTGFRTLVVECSKGDAFSIDVEVNSSTTSSCIFWDKDGKYMIDLDRGAGKRLYNHEVTPPLGAAFMSVTSVWAGNPPLKPVIRKFQMNDTNNIKTEIKDVSDRLLSFTKQDLSITNGFLTYASPNVNSITTNSGYKTIVTEVVEGEIWNVDTTLNNLNTSAVCFWNKEGKFLGDLERGGKGTLEWYKFKIPPKVKTISTSSLSSGVTPVFRKGESTDLLEIDKRVAAIEKDISGKEETNILSVGDSTIGNYDDASSVTQQIARFLSANVTNAGFGGCRMGKHAQYWDAFSFYRLMAELVKDNSDPTKWKIQDEAIAAGLSGTWTNMPGYFPSRLERLKKVDMSKINILTIGYGTNDYTGGNPIDNLENQFDITTFGGALRYGLSKFMAKFPHIKILIYTPTYRVWFNEDKTFKEDSDTTDYAKTGTLPEYVDKEIEVAKEFKVPYLDSYRNMGVNKYNYSIAFTYPDGVHHDGNGRKLFGEMIAKKILTL